jgi:lipopolysaccharide heptosyltransferase II
MQKILVCHTGAWIGDMVLLTPALCALKQTLPQSCLTLLLRPHVADLMETNPYVDKYIVDNKTESHYGSFWKLARKIRKINFDIAVVLHPTSIRNALLPFIARIPVRIGSNYKGRGVLLTAFSPHKTDIHEVDRYLRVIQLLNIDSASISKPLLGTENTTSTNLEFWHTDADRQSLKALLQNEGVSSEDRLLAINLGTTWITKQWDVSNFAEVINQILRATPDVKIVLTGSKAEKAQAEKLPLSESTINLVGKTDIMQLGALLERCKVCLTCDSGPMHIAAAVGTPTVALFGPTNPTRHRPYSKGHTIIEKPVSCRPCYKRTCYRKDIPYHCMQEINPTEVVNAIISKLNQKNSNN